MIMIDSDVLIWYMRGNLKANKTIEKLNGFFVSVVTYMELVQSMRNKRELTLLRTALRKWCQGSVHSPCQGQFIPHLKNQISDLKNRQKNTK